MSAKLCLWFQGTNTVWHLGLIMQGRLHTDHRRHWWNQEALIWSCRLKDQGVPFRKMPMWKSNSCYNIKIFSTNLHGNVMKTPSLSTDCQQTCFLTIMDDGCNSVFHFSNTEKRNCWENQPSLMEQKHTLFPLPKLQYSIMRTAKQTPIISIFQPTLSLPSVTHWRNEVRLEAPTCWTNPREQLESETLLSPSRVKSIIIDQVIVRCYYPAFFPPLKRSDQKQFCFPPCWGRFAPQVSRTAGSIPQLEWMPEVHQIFWQECNC